MMNMNLSTAQANDPNKHIGKSSMGLIVMAVAFLLVAGATGGLIIWKNSLRSQVSAADAVYKEKYDQLIREERNKDVVDFQNRITMANELIKERNMILEGLRFVEKNMVDGVYLVGYKSEKKSKTLSLEGVAGNLDAIAKQTVSFKSSDLFSAVDVAKIGLSPEGKIIFSMEIKIN
jgi:hypothetical protein